MKVLVVTDGDLRNVEAHVKLGSIEWSERRRLAATSEDAPLLIALSEPDHEWDDHDIIENLLKNQHTPSLALKNITERKPRQGQDSFFVTEDEKKIERWTIAAVNHQNTSPAFLEEMSNHPNWVIRYAVALQGRRASEQTRRKLAKDTHLAVAAMAARQLQLRTVDDGMNVGVTCAEINEAFEKIRDGMLKGQDMLKPLAQKLEVDDVGDYDRFWEVFNEAKATVEKLKDKLVDAYASLLQKRLIPNINLDPSHCKDALDKFGELHFDAYIIASQVKELLDQSAEISMQQTLEKARGLLPYVSGGRLTDPQRIIRERRLELNFYRVSVFSNSAYIDSKGVDELVALDKLSRIVLCGADPSKVDEHITEKLGYRRTGTEIFQKIKLTTGPIIAIRLFKNGKLIVEYGSDADARKIAESLT